MAKILLTVAAVLSAVNIALFILWLSLVKVEAVPPGEGGSRSEFILNSLSLQITVLEVVMAAVAIALAAIGLFGYQSVKDAAVEKALTETRKQVSAHLNKLKSEGGLDKTDPNPKRTDLGSQVSEEEASL